VLAPRACHTSGPWNVLLKALNAAALASSRTVTPCAGPAADGGIGELVFQVAGILDDAGHPLVMSGRDNGADVDLKICATPLVTAIC
jgi:hypothetical protein